MTFEMQKTRVKTSDRWKAKCKLLDANTFKLCIGRLRWNLV